MAQQGQSHAQWPAVNEARLVEWMEDWTHERCGGARVIYAGTKVSTMTIGAPQRRHTKHGGVVVSVCGLRGGASLSSARASARLAVRVELTRFRGHVILREGGVHHVEV
jgi:hypothetical protein